MTRLLYIPSPPTDGPKGQDGMEGGGGVKPPGLGSLRRDGRNARRIFVSFDDETFDQIRAHAVAGGLSFTGAVRELVEWGLLDATEQRAAA